LSLAVSIFILKNSSVAFP